MIIKFGSRIGSGHCPLFYFVDFVICLKYNYSVILYNSGSIGMITEIISSSNNLFKNTKKLLNSQERKKVKKFIVEGYRIVSDAVRHKADIDYIVVSSDYSNTTFEDKYKVYRMDKKLFSQISDTVNSQGIIAVVNYPQNVNPEYKNLESIVYLDGVSDPGNMGTILRTCDAMGVDAVIVSKGCVDIYNPKVVRSTMASLFNVPVVYDTNEDMLDELKENGYTVVGTILDGSDTIFNCDLTQKTVIVMGNEANGISEKVRNKCDVRIRIPMTGGAESLNVAVCCSMVLYERMRQKVKEA